MNHANTDIPTRDAKGKVLDAGVSGIVELQDDGFVIKSPWLNDAQCYSDMVVEAMVYKRLQARFGSHKRFLQQISFDERDHTLTMEYMSNGTLRSYLQAHPVDITNEQRYTWALAAAQGMMMLHSIGVIHCDFSPNNILLDDSLELKVIDFGCSSVDGARSSGGGDIRSYPALTPKASGLFEVKHDVFALGCTIYEICSGRVVHHELSSRHAVDLIDKHEMPDLSGIGPSDAIRACWDGNYHSANSIYQLLSAQLGG